MSNTISFSFLPSLNNGSTGSVSGPTIAETGREYEQYSTQFDWSWDQTHQFQCQYWQTDYHPHRIRHKFEASKFLPNTMLLIAFGTTVLWISVGHFAVLYPSYRDERTNFGCPGRNWKIRKASTHVNPWSICCYSRVRSYTIHLMSNFLLCTAVNCANTELSSPIYHGFSISRKP